MTSGDWDTDPQDLTLPPGAGAGAARIVLGPDVPPELAAYYLGLGLTVVSAILFYDQFGNYYYYAALEASAGSYWHARGVGSPSNIPKIFEYWRESFQLVGFDKRYQVGSDVAGSQTTRFQFGRQGTPVTTPGIEGQVSIGFGLDFFIDAISQPRGVLDFVSSAANTAVSLAGAESVCLLSSNVTFFNSRAFRIEYHQLDQGAAVGFAEMRIRRNGPGTLLLDDVHMLPTAGVRTTCQASGIVINNSGATITDQIAFNHVGSVNIQGIAATTSLRWLMISDAGAAARFPGAIQM